MRSSSGVISCNKQLILLSVLFLPGAVARFRPPCKIYAPELSGKPLRFVQRGRILLRCGSATALSLPSLGVSSLDLGRLFIQAALFSWHCHPSAVDDEPRSFGRRLEWAEIIKRNRSQRLGQGRKVARHLRKSCAARAPPLIHVDRAVEFELDGMQPGCRVAVMLGDEAAGIGLVTPDRIAEPVDDSDDGERNSRSDQAVFDGGPRIGPPEMPELSVST